MVVQENNVTMEVPVSKTKKYVVIKNHVRELLPKNEIEVQGSVLPVSDTKSVGKPNVTEKKALKRKRVSQLSSVPESTDISGSDLEELRTVYRKCKMVLHNIESKYGHLLNLEDKELGEGSKNSFNERSGCYYCRSTPKRKILFDENGQQREEEYNLDRHICFKRNKKNHSYIQAHDNSVQIEYDDYDSLPNNLQELENILKDLRIHQSYRRMVIDKIYFLRQEYLNEIRYEKWNIIKKIKDNSEAVLDFKGTNLSSLPGYPTKPVIQMEKTIL